MLRTIIKYQFGRSKPQSVREFTDKSKAGWSRKQKLMAYTIFGLAGLKMYTHLTQVDLIFTFMPTQENLDMIKHCPSLRAGVFRPTFYLPSALLQTLYGSLIDPVPYIPFKRESVVVDKDGGTITLDYVPVYSKYLNSNKQELDNMPILIILHGLTGASESNYIRHAALYGSRKGFRTICLNLRGYSNSELTSPMLSDLTNLNDVSKGFSYIREKYPKSNVYAMTFSLGSNLLIRYLEDNDINIKAAVAVSTPWNILQLSKHIQKPSKWLYDFGITRNFKRNLRWNLEIMRSTEKSHGVELDKALKSWRTSQYDEYITRRLMGYNSIQDLYDKVQCTNVLKEIDIPLLLISSQDDPVIPSKELPKEQILQNSRLVSVQTQKGGHIEFFTSYKAIRWISRPGVEFLRYFEQIKQ